MVRRFYVPTRIPPDGIFGKDKWQSKPSTQLGSPSFKRQQFINMQSVTYELQISEEARPLFWILNLMVGMNVAEKTTRRRGAHTGRRC